MGFCSSSLDISCLFYMLEDSSSSRMLFWMVARFALLKSSLFVSLGVARSSKSLSHCSKIWLWSVYSVLFTKRTLVVVFPVFPCLLTSLWKSLVSVEEAFMTSWCSRSLREAYALLCSALILLFFLIYDCLSAGISTSLVQLFQFLYALLAASIAMLMLFQIALPTLFL